MKTTTQYSKKKGDERLAHRRIQRNGVRQFSPLCVSLTAEPAVAWFAK
jgi:hypothetical protein